MIAMYVGIMVMNRRGVHIEVQLHFSYNNIHDSDLLDRS
jgi:hypothetical protein